MYSNVNSAEKAAVLDGEDKKGEVQVAERSVCCPSAFNKLYYYLDSILDKVLWSDAASSTPDNPLFTKAERYNIFFYIVGIMCYKVRIHVSPPKLRPAPISPLFTTITNI